MNRHKLLYILVIVGLVLSAGLGTAIVAADTDADDGSDVDVSESNEESQEESEEVEEGEVTESDARTNAIMDISNTLYVQDYRETDNGLEVDVYSTRPQSVGWTADYGETWRYGSVTVGEGEYTITIPHQDADDYGLSSQGTGKWLDAGRSTTLLPDIPATYGLGIGVVVTFSTLLAKARKRRREWDKTVERVK